MPRVPLGATALLLALTACGRAETSRPPASQPWNFAREEARLPFDITERERGERTIHLPEAPHGHTDCRDFGDPIRRYILNLRADVTLVFKKKEWPLAPRDADSIDAIDALRRELTAITRRRDGGPRPFDLVLRCDRAALHGGVRKVIDAALEPPLAVRRIEIATFHPDDALSFMDAKIAAEVTKEDDSLRVESVSLERAPAGTVRLDFGERTFEGPASPYADAATVGMADAMWGEVERWWTTHPPRSGGVFRIADDVPWCYVVEILDLAIAHGADEVRTSDRVRWRFLPAEPCAAIVWPGDAHSRDWPLAVGLLAGGALAAALFAVAALAGRRRRRVLSRVGRAVEP